MWSLAKTALCASTVGAVALVSLVVWGLGGPVEANAVARIDRWQTVPLMPMGTCYPPAFSNAAYARVAIGEAAGDVRARLGEPFAIGWMLDEQLIGKFIWFKHAGGAWRSTYAHDVQVPAGTPMSALEGLRPEVVEEVWSYSRSCTPDASRRVRSLVVRGGRVASRASGIYYD